MVDFEKDELNINSITVACWCWWGFQSLRRKINKINHDSILHFMNEKFSFEIWFNLTILTIWYTFHMNSSNLKSLQIVFDLTQYSKMLPHSLHVFWWEFGMTNRISFEKSLPNDFYSWKRIVFAVFVFQYWFSNKAIRKSALLTDLLTCTSLFSMNWWGPAL